MHGFPHYLISVLFLSAAATIAAPPAVVFDLNGQSTETDTLMRVNGHGSVNDGQPGVPLCGGFHCGGDGFKDVAMAHIQNDPLGRTGAGSVTLVFGDGAVGGTYDTSSFSSRVLKIAGDQSREIAGAEIWMDDVSGDGLGDLLIGRQNYMPATGREGAGALTIIFGSDLLRSNAARLAYFDLRSPPPGTKLLTIVGASAYDRLGIWMRTGDVDGDGQADIVVGADEADQTGEAVTYNSGSAYVIRGGPHLVAGSSTLDLANFGSTPFEGHVACILPPLGASDYHMGGTVDLGDLDGNGRAEVLLAATMHRSGAGLRLPSAPGGTGEASGGTADGTLFIAWDENFPSCMWPTGYTFRILSPPYGDVTRIDGYRNDGIQSDHHFGEDIQAGLDLSGDSFPDLFIGDINGLTTNGISSGLSYVIYNASCLRGLNFHMTDVPSNVAVSTILGPMIGALGGDTGALGDFDGDGIGDLAVGSPHNAVNGRVNAGSVHILYGQPGGWPALIDLSEGNLPGPAEARVLLVKGALGNAGDTGDVLCYSAAVADIDGDGRDDFIVNEMEGNGFGGFPADVGNLLVISGAALMDSPDASLYLVPSGRVDFGAQDVAAGATGAKSVVISNHTAGSVVLLSLALDGPAAGSFNISSDTGETNLPAGTMRTVELTYDPETIGNHGAALVVVTDTDTHRLGLGLSGTGIDLSEELRIQALRISDDKVCIRFSSQRGYEYALLQGSNLVSMTTNLLGIHGTGGDVPVIDVGAVSNAMMFYRVEGTTR